MRKSRPLFETLHAAGVELGLQNLPGTWPVELVSAAPPDALVLREPAGRQRGVAGPPLVAEEQSQRGPAEGADEVASPVQAGAIAAGQQTFGKATTHP
jgi:hypothetical protein